MTKKIPDQVGNDNINILFTNNKCMLKLLTIIGARPQIIKAAALSRAIHNKFSDQIQEIIVHTGQHYDDRMSKAFFEALNIPVTNINLGIGSGTHAEQVGQSMIVLEKVFTVKFEL